MTIQRVFSILWTGQLVAFQLLALHFLEFVAADVTDATKKLDILYAVNCGGEDYVDHYGVSFAADPSTDGTASDYGLRWTMISNAHPDDFILYQTERYSESTFGYTVPFPKKDKSTSQNYVLVMKFAEVYFNQPGMKVFDVLLNGDHLVVDGLDIFERAGGRAAAYEVHVPFRIAGNKLILLNTGEESDFTGSLRIDFVKTSQDNPKCNAFYIARGNLEDIPKPEMRPTTPLGEDGEEFDASDAGDFDHSPWTSPEFPAPAQDPEVDFGIERYYPVMAVFLFIAVITFFLFKL